MLEIADRKVNLGDFRIMLLISKYKLTSSVSKVSTGFVPKVRYIHGPVCICGKTVGHLPNLLTL